MFSKKSLALPRDSSAPVFDEKWNVLSIVSVRLQKAEIVCMEPWSEIMKWAVNLGYNLVLA